MRMIGDGLPGGRRARTGQAVAAAMFSLWIAGASSARGQNSEIPSAGPKTFDFSGYAQVLGTIQNPETDGFSIRRVRLTLSVDVLKNLSLRVQVDPGKSPALFDAQVDWTPAEFLALRFGQFRIPFSLEGLTPSSELDLVNRSQVVNALAPGWDIGSSGRDIGAAVIGRFTVFEYSVGVFNGAGINKADTNGSKDADVRLVMRPSSGLEIGVSAYDGKYAPSAGAPSVVRARIGAEAAWVTPVVSFKGEYILAKDDTVSKNGWYVQAGVSVLPKTLQGVVRFDAYDKNRQTRGDRIDAWTAGFNWFFAARTKLQVNYELDRMENGATVKRAVFVQFQIGF